MESKPYERMDIYQRKKRKKGNENISIVMKTCFSEEKLIKQFGTTPTTPP